MHRCLTKCFREPVIDAALYGIEARVRRVEGYLVLQASGSDPLLKKNMI